MTDSQLTVVADTTDTLAVAKAARAWLDDPAHWTTGTFSRDDAGSELGMGGCRSKKTVASTCAQGAIALVMADCWDPVDWTVIARKIAEMAYPGSAAPTYRMQHVNDRDPDGYAKILAAFDTAIAKLEADAA